MSGQAPVGSFRPNPFGLHDTIGNVAEWCLDDATTYTQPTHGPDALRVRLSDGGDPEYIVRGGAFNMRACASTSYRRSYSVESGFRNIGVRPARMIETNGSDAKKKQGRRGVVVVVGEAAGCSPNRAGERLEMVEEFGWASAFHGGKIGRPSGDADGTTIEGVLVG